MRLFNFDLLTIILTIPGALIAFTAQGYARALVADKLGDKTPRFQGRLTLNPAAHIDPIGFLMILLVGFGWTKPINTNPSAYKRGYKDAIKVSIAAPIANLLVGFIAMILYVFCYKFLLNILPDTAFYILSRMIGYTASINISLFVFTLLPLPGLAGFDIFRDLWPKTFYKVSDKIYQYQFLILIAIILVGGRILSIPVSFIYNLFLTIGKLIFGI
ncbi:site-2 protease family protein [Clostridium celatum]|uniref:Peptidase, M50 family n=1 Tax=Clostridium celatum DSM 1785 TaxID=545697 RepID=L1QEA7_9CLOT|nr:site-2 protease family protein [Clostridium celatum]EKY26281.1 peptidase, M50 family [Clostridium celatum DSM 1785]MCE9653992.1 site-2 protease family protein [Clostridium celatum]MDU2264988.1 site-2 protease family protein [Clostridium celatum]MDU3723393.1 site-2 protease family protein [Clostridium celatum]MDU6294334.1 site-2 protease family protein [Clostridium celatum]